jgi:hypothetical protein
MNLVASDSTLVIGTGLLVCILRCSQELQCLQHLLASHIAFATELPSEIHLALFETIVYGRSVNMFPLASWARFAQWPASSFQGMPEYPETTFILVAMLFPRRGPALLLIRLTNCCPMSGSACAFHPIGDCGLQQTTTVFTPCLCIRCLSIVKSRASPISHSSASKICMCPVYRELWRDRH